MLSDEQLTKLEDIADSIAVTAGAEAVVKQLIAQAREAMAKRRIDISGHRSKHMDEFAGQQFDYVITVCDNASEACPVFPGTPERIHWSIPDPSASQGSEKERFVAFERAATDLVTRIRYFVTFAERRDAAR